jgi:hypothetical protein
MRLAFTSCACRSPPLDDGGMADGCGLELGWPIRLQRCSACRPALEEYTVSSIEAQSGVQMPGNRRQYVSGSAPDR